MKIDQIKLPIGYTDGELRQAVMKAGHLKPAQVEHLTILRRSIDARKKPELHYVISVETEPKKQTSSHATIPKEILNGILPVVVIGSGPAGMFAAMTLSQAGVPVILCERGKDVDSRKKDVENFWNGAELNPESNVQFGEGGAGTFSDGKLNTLTKDKTGLNGRVLQMFYEAGASEEILYDSKPHIGTDVLHDIVKNFRNEILTHGGEIRFSSKVVDFILEENENVSEVRNSLKKTKISGVVVEQENTKEKNTISCSNVILAIGHSARDTFYLLQERGVFMEAKPFAVGIRMEHPQEMITKSQYGTLDYEELGAAPYKVTAKTAGGRGVYSFCMCPGGYVVNASSEQERLAINGMSYHDRRSSNANAGIIVQVTPEDYPENGPLAGVEFQRKLEKKAYLAAHGRIPVQLYQDFKMNRISNSFGDVKPQMKGEYDFGNLHEVLPEPICDALQEAIPKFGRMIAGFDRPDGILSAVESRTSSPVRIVRDEEGESNVAGLYPCGEGAGYAGGITSAAMDGIRMAEKIIEKIK